MPPQDGNSHLHAHVEVTDGTLKVVDFTSQEMAFSPPPSLCGAHLLRGGENFCIQKSCHHPKEEDLVL